MNPTLRRQFPSLVMVVLTMFLGACDASTSTAPEPNTTGTAAPEVDETAAPEITENATTAVALDGAGVRFVDEATGSARAIAFQEVSTEQVVTALSNVRGAPQDEGENTECGAGPLTYATWADGLTLYGSGGEFAGWAVNGNRSPSAVDYTTMSGVGVGSTRTELEEAYSVEVSDSTLGTEFAAGELYGLLSGPEPEATVTNLWAGASCNFR